MAPNGALTRSLIRSLHRAMPQVDQRSSRIRRTCPPAQRRPSPRVAPWPPSTALSPWKKSPHWIGETPRARFRRPQHSTRGGSSTGRTSARS